MMAEQLRPQEVGCGSLMNDASSSHVYSDAQQHPSKRKKVVESWLCDVCKTARFDTFDEACRHEEICLKEKEAAETKAKSEQEAAAAATAKPVHPFFAGSSKQRKQNEKATKSCSKDKANDSNSKRRQRNADSSKDDAYKKTKKTKKEVATSQTTLTAANNHKKVLQDRVLDKPFSCSNKTANTKGKTIIDLNVPSSKEINGNPSVQTKPQKKRKKNVANNSSCNEDKDEPVEIVKVKPAAAKKTSKPKMPMAPLASIFQKGSKPVDEKAFMAEQRAAELQAKRRMEREKDRERQRKRQETFFQKRTAVDSHQRVKSQLNHSNNNKAKHSCPQFPVPNHVLGDKTETILIPERPRVYVTDHQLAETRKNLQTMLPYPSEKVNLQFASEGVSDWKFNSSDSSWIPKDDYSDLIQHQLARVLCAPTSTKNENSQHRLWVDKYVLDVNNVCGGDSQQASKELIEFVQEWMVHRQQANERMAERQKSLQKKKLASKKVVYKDDDEYLFSDEEGSELPSVCLVQGPVGSCKSSLVHAVAKHCGCQVLELNTSDKRGSTDLRKALEEATQSQSSLDMLKKREASLSVKQQLVDSDSEGDEGDENGKNKGTSLTVILIDEGELGWNSI